MIRTGRFPDNGQSLPDSSLPWTICGMFMKYTTRISVLAGTDTILRQRHQHFHAEKSVLLADQALTVVFFYGFPDVPDPETV